MVVPFGVGVGDFIAVAKLTKDIVAELKKDSKAVSHYQNLVVELESLDSALSRINEIKPARHELVHLDAIRAAAAACERPLEAFLAKLKKYDSTMGSWSAGDKRFGGIGRRVQYGFDIWGDVPELRTALASHIATITILMLAQTMSVISKQKSSSDLKTHKEALDTLKATIDQSNDLCRETTDGAENALAILQEAIEQSHEINSEVRSELKRYSKRGRNSQPLTIDEVAKSITKLEAKPRGEGNGQDEEDVRNLQKEIFHLGAEIDRVKEHISIPSRMQGVGKPSILDTTSKVLNLVLSGIMAASVWTLMNQSQEIVTLSRMLIENCNVNSGLPSNSSLLGSSNHLTTGISHELNTLDIISPKPDDAEVPTPPETWGIRRNSDPLGPAKILSHDAGPKEGPTFIVRINNLDPVFDGHTPRLHENLVWDPPESPKDFRLGKAVLFR